MKFLMFLLMLYFALILLFSNSDLKKIVSVSKEVTLANDADFNAFYMGAMMFTKK